MKHYSLTVTFDFFEVVPFLDVVPFRDKERLGLFMRVFEIPFQSQSGEGQCVGMIRESSIRRKVCEG